VVVVAHQAEPQARGARLMAAIQGQAAPYPVRLPTRVHAVSHFLARQTTYRQRFLAMGTEVLMTVAADRRSKAAVEQAMNSARHLLIDFGREAWAWGEGALAQLNRRQAAGQVVNIPPSLHGLSGGGRVIYVGTFSKAMFPAIRLTYLIAPPALVDAFASVRVRQDGPTQLHGQAALADFMESGAFAGHIKRMRGLYAEREGALLSHLGRRLGGVLHLPEPGGGLQLAARFRHMIDDQLLVQQLLPEEAAPMPLSRYYLGQATPGLLIGFANGEPARLERAVDHLARTYESGLWRKG